MKNKLEKETEILSIIEQQGAARFERCFKVCGTVLSFFECLMIVNIIFTSSGGNYKPYYLALYIFLLSILLALLAIFHFSKKMEPARRTKLIRRAEIAFIIAIELWAVGITFVDTLSHQLMDLLVYISILTLLPSIVFIHPAIGISSQVFFDLLIYAGIFIFDSARAKYLFINFSTYALVAIIIYALTYKIQKELYEREAELKKASENDPLTGLRNRFSYSNFIQMLRDHPENKQFAILLLDLNGLKTTNDTMGHKYGDDLITGAAWCINKAFHKNGVCFRTGGDEFVVILNKRLTEIQPMLRTFEALCRDWKGELISSPSVSYGLAEAFEEIDLNVDQLIELADKRMYEMKQKYYQQTGKDRRK